MGEKVTRSTSFAQMFQTKLAEAVCLVAGMDDHLRNFPSGGRIEYLKSARSVDMLSVSFEDGEEPQELISDDRDVEFVDAALNSR